MTPEEFKTELLEFIISAGFYPNINPWQIDIAERIMNDYALITGQLINSDICKTCPAPASCSEPCKQVKKGWSVKAKQEEVNPMASYASAQIIADTSEKDQRDYARSRIRSIKGAKEDQFQKDFGLTDDKRPATPAEFVKRIADGLYTIDKENLDVNFYRPSDAIRWRDPAKVEDREGYKAAVEKLDAAYTEAKDAIVLAPISDLKAAIDKFAAFTLG